MTPLSALMRVRLGQPLVVLRPQPPGERAPHVSDALLQCLRLRGRRIRQVPLELTQALGHDPLVRGREIVRSRRREDP